MHLIAADCSGIIRFGQRAPAASLRCGAGHCSPFDVVLRVTGEQQQRISSDIVPVYWSRRGVTGRMYAPKSARCSTHSFIRPWRHEVIAPFGPQRLAQQHFWTGRGARFCKPQSGLIAIAVNSELSFWIWRLSLAVFSEMGGT